MQGVCTLTEQPPDMHETHVKLVLDEETLDTLLIKLIFLDFGEGCVQMLVERHRTVFSRYALGFGSVIIASSLLLFERKLSARLTIWEASQVFFERKVGFVKLI